MIVVPSENDVRDAFGQRFARFSIPLHVTRRDARYEVELGGGGAQAYLAFEIDFANDIATNGCFGLAQEIPAFRRAHLALDIIAAAEDACAALGIREAVVGLSTKDALWSHAGYSKVPNHELSAYESRGVSTLFGFSTFRKRF